MTTGNVVGFTRRLGTTPGVGFQMSVTAPDAPPPPPPPQNPSIFQDLYHEETWDPTFTQRFRIYNNSTFGREADNPRIQRYMAANVQVVNNPNSVSGRTLKIRALEDSSVDSGYTSGMLDTRGRGFYFPIYGYFESWSRIPHGQGLWPSEWLTGRNGGADMIEHDKMEYFHGQTPGRIRYTLHRRIGPNPDDRRYNVAKDPYPGLFYESPRYSNHRTIKHGIEIAPVTDASGTTLAPFNQPSNFVRIRLFQDDVLYWTHVDTQSLYWTTNCNGYQLYLQIQIGGSWVGHPKDPRAVSRWGTRTPSGSYLEPLTGHRYNPQCLISGTAPNSCAISRQGQTVIVPQFGDPSSTYEFDMIRVWSAQGALAA